MHENDPQTAGRGSSVAVWLVAAAIVLVWFAVTWMTHPVPPRPDDRPIGDLAAALGFVVLPLALLLGFAGGTAARKWPRAAPVTSAIAAMLVAAVVVVGATGAGFTSFTIRCGTAGYPECGTGVASRMAALAGALLIWLAASGVALAAARRRSPRKIPSDSSATAPSRMWAPPLRPPVG